MRNQLNSCRDNYNFVATMTQEKVQAAVSRSSHNNSEDIQQLNIVVTIIHLSRQSTRDQKLNNKKDILKTNLDEKR